MNATQMKILKPYREMQSFLETSHIGRLADGGVEALCQRLEDEGSGAIRAIQIPWRQTHKSVGYGFAPGQVSFLAGTSGGAKSYWVLNLLRNAWQQGVRWQLLPLEDDAGRWIQRMIAVHTCSWAMVMQPKEDTPEERRRSADAKLAALNEHRDFVDEMYQRIAENPRLPVDDGTGGMVSKDVDCDGVLTFIREAAEDNDLLVVDPITQISFGRDGNVWDAQEKFMRDVVAIAATTGVHILVVAHFAKGGSNAADPLDGIAGSSLFGKIAHNALLLIRHDPTIESNVIARINPTVEHRITITVQKGRGGLSGNKIAFDLHEHGPQFIEYGLIKPKGKK